MGVSQPQLDQNSRLIVIPKGIKVEKGKLSITGIEKVTHGIYIVQKKRRNVIETLEHIQHIRFRKARDIPKSDSRKKLPFQERIYSLVSYSIKQPTPQQKKKLQRIIYRTACVRLAPGIFVSPHLRAKEKQRYFTEKDGITLYDSAAFAREISNLGAETRRWTRLMLVNKSGEDLIHNAFLMMMQKEIESINQRMRTIEEKSKEIDASKKKLLESLKAVRAHFNHLKLKHNILRAIWYYDYEKELKRTYNQMLRIRRKIREM